MKILDWKRIIPAIQPQSERVENQAFICLATEDYFTKGCMVVVRSLKRVGTTRKIITLVTNHVSNSAREKLIANGAEIRVIETIPGSKKVWHEDCMTKFRVWQLTDLEKIIYLDADEIVLKNIDYLFDFPELSACHDPMNLLYWPGVNILNSALFVAQPSNKTFNELMDALVTHPHYNTDRIGDGNVFNRYFTKWTPLQPNVLVISWMFEIRQLDRQLLLESTKVRFTCQLSGFTI